MHPYPHTYSAGASGHSKGSVAVTSPQLPTLQTAAPPQFDGPEGLWSPETLLCASLADCFVLTFRALSRVAHFEWLHLDCRVEGVLERIGQGSQFTHYITRACLKVSPGSDLGKARALLERAEHGCLIANSLSGKRTLQAEVEVENSTATTAVG